MAVNWQCTTCAAYIEAKEFGLESDEWNAFANLRQALIYALLATEFPKDSDWAITEGNWEETYCRLDMLERVNGSMRSTDKESIYLTPKEVHSMIGLSVNAGTQSRKDFSKRLIRNIELDANRRLRNFLKAK